MNKIKDNETNDIDYMILMSIFTISILSTFFFISN